MLRLYNLQTGERLPTSDEEVLARQAAEARVAELEAEVAHLRAELAQRTVSNASVRSSTSEDA
ncbi:hypothetical protein [Roseiflexus sp.]|uniref:hypothetical protein n=1 Tax=Roseiflexus sp. TaxID=2562120 RepID=UPI00398B2AD8